MTINLWVEVHISKTGGSRWVIAFISWAGAALVQEKEAGVYIMHNRYYGNGEGGWTLLGKQIKPQFVEKMHIFMTMAKLKYLVLFYVYYLCSVGLSSSSVQYIYFIEVVKHNIKQTSKITAITTPGSLERTFGPGCLAGTWSPSRYHLLSLCLLSFSLAPNWDTWCFFMPTLLNVLYVV